VSDIISFIKRIASLKVHPVEWSASVVIPIIVECSLSMPWDVDYEIEIDWSASMNMECGIDA
jgi:hypothetical protein